MLRVALPNKGQLALPAAALLSEAGYLASANPRALVVTDLANDVEFFFLDQKMSRFMSDREPLILE